MDARPIPAYAVAQVELEEKPGLILVTNIVDADVADVRIGQPVEITFEGRSADLTIRQCRRRPLR